MAIPQHSTSKACFGHTTKYTGLNIQYRLILTEISCTPTCFVGQQIRDSSKLLRYGASPHHRPRNLGVFSDHPTENHLSHVQIDTQTELNKDRGLTLFVTCKPNATLQTTVPQKRSLSTHLMGTMLEKRSRKRKIWRYQRPAKCWRATMTRDTTTSAPKRILVKQFTSRSNKPTCQERQKQMLRGNHKSSAHCQHNGHCMHRIRSKPLKS